MSFSIGIIGLPNVGKSTLFKALTKKEVEIAAYPFTTINPNIGIVAVPDKRLEKIAGIIKPEKITPAVIEFIDIAGLIKGAHKGEGLGNQFLAQIRNCDAVLEVIKVFKNKSIGDSSPLKPEEDIKTIETELLMKDLETLQKISNKLGKGKIDKEEKEKKEIIDKLIKEINQGKRISEINLSEEEKRKIKEYKLLTEKPIIYVLNIDRENKKSKLPGNCLVLNLKEEVDISEFSESELRELEIKPLLDRLIISCYNTLNLITFYTIKGGEETRAWTLEKGSGILKAGRLVHSDFEKKFVKAEVLKWEKLLEFKSWHKAKEEGEVKIVGKTYQVEDGDIIEFKI